MAWGTGALAQPVSPTPSPQLRAPNARVNTALVDGSTLYMGGSFTLVGKPTGAFAVVDDQARVTSSLAAVEGTVLAAAPDGAGGWYVGGDFETVAGQTRHNAAHLRADGSLAPWSPDPGDTVFGIVAVGNTVYLGGVFRDFAGVTPKNYLAAVDGVTGAVEAWNPNPNGFIRGLRLDGQRLYVYGQFSGIGGFGRGGVAIYNLPARTIDPLNPSPSFVGCDIRAIAPAGNTLYLAGAWRPGGQPANLYVGAADLAAGGVVRWSKGFSPRSVFALHTVGTTLYVGGSFDQIAGVPRASLAALSAATGAVLPFNPTLVRENSGYPVVNALTSIGTTLYVGGDFQTANGVGRLSASAFDTSTGALTDWAPQVGGPSNSAAVECMTPDGAGGIGLGGSSLVLMETQPRYGLAALDLPGGDLLPFDAGLGGVGFPATVNVQQALIHRGRLYIVGGFSLPGSQIRGLAAFDPATGALIPTFDTSPSRSDGYNQPLAAAGDLIIAVVFTGNNRAVVALDAKSGELRWRQPLVQGGTSFAVSAERGRLYVGNGETIAELDLASGRLLAAPARPAGTRGLLPLGERDLVYGRFTEISGQSVPYAAMVHWLDDAEFQVLPWNLSFNGEVSGLRGWSRFLAAHGAFTSVGAQSRRGLAIADPQTNTVMPWNPSSNRTGWIVASFGDSGLVLTGDGPANIGGVFRPFVAHFAPAP